MLVFFFFFQAEDGIRDLVRSRGLGDVYKRQPLTRYEVPVVSGFWPNGSLYQVMTPLPAADSVALSLIHI